ncbi:MAG: hypothetical protein QOJ64_1560 [Acidobacteriota bacterium]|jgi:glycosyltransferase involved in cell wall biosynthesis|nr:hypothetical protein [Acidobacteriota bacterium]
MTASVTVSHPHGNPNSYHAAKAFADTGLLNIFERGFVTGRFASKALADLPQGRKALQRGLGQLANGGNRQHLLWEVISRVGKRLKSTGPTQKVSWYDVLYCGHDWQVSKALRKGMTAVYAYEDGACLTFREAKRTRAATIYELPAGYYAGVAHELDRARDNSREPVFNIKTEPRWKMRRKDHELSLADVIVVPCEWAAESLRFSGINTEKAVIKVPYGTPAVEVFPKLERPRGPFTVLFAGQVGARKGVPYLLEAWSQLGLKNARLLLAGGMKLNDAFLSRYSGNFEYLGALPRLQLLKLMKEVDLLVFPSLAEGFGLVIGEAMAAGTPVLTTTNTGGPELITNGREGWCVPAHDAQVLAERIEWAYQHRDELFEMGRRARQRAEQWTWADYRHSLIEKIMPHLNGVAASSSSYVEV